MPYDLCEDETTLSYIENEMARRGVTQELIDDTRSQTERQMLNDLQLLQMDGGDLDFKDPISGASSLHIASANGYLSVVEFLLDHHVSTEGNVACDNFEIFYKYSFIHQLQQYFNLTCIIRVFYF